VPLDGGIIDRIEKLPRLYSKAVGYAQDGRQPRLARPSLKAADGGWMNIGLSRNIVLGEPTLGAQLLEPLTECLARSSWIVPLQSHRPGCSTLPADRSRAIW
jgi:hypothetical protein